MLKCPFCGFSNEEGALFCEQCKSDISGELPAAPTPVEPIPEAPVMAAIVEEPAAAAIMPDEVPATVAPPADVTEASQAPPEPLTPPPPLEAAPAPPPPPVEPPPPPAVPVAAAPKPGPAPIPSGAQPKLLVQRGLKINEEYNIYAGENYIGRADEKPVDIDLTFQEPEDRVWVSRQHALVVFDEATGMLTVEDLNSANGTFVNRERVYPGQPKQLAVGSTMQIGTVHMRVKV